MSSFVIKENVGLFDQSYYIQILRTAMISPLEPTIANSFLCCQEGKELQEYSKDLKPAFHIRGTLMT